MLNLRIWLKAVIETGVIMLAVLAVWYGYEYKQFGELQWNRKCDEIVCIIFFYIIFFLLLTIYKQEKAMKERILRMIDERVSESKKQQQFFAESGDTITARQFYFMAKEAEAIRRMVEQISEE